MKDKTNIMVIIFFASIFILMATLLFTEPARVWYTDGEGFWVDDVHDWRSKYRMYIIFVEAGILFSLTIYAWRKLFWKNEGGG